MDELQELQNKVSQLEEQVKSLEGEKEALLRKNREILDEKKKLQGRIESDYIPKSEADNMESDRIKNLETMLSQLKESYETERKAAKEKEQKLREQSITSAVISEFSTVCHNPSDFADFLRYKGIATTNEEGKPAIIWNGEELSPAAFKEKAINEPTFQYHFKPSGAFGTGKNVQGANTSTKSNPFAAESFNLTEQMRLLKENPALASKLKGEAKQR